MDSECGVDDRRDAGAHAGSERMSIRGLLGAALCPPALIAGLFTGLSRRALAHDTLVLKDGRTFSGHVLADDGSKVRFETHYQGMTLTTVYPRTSVASLSRENAVGPSYCALPIIGPIGRVSAEKQFVSAEAFKAALAQVRKSKPAFVVLVIDSPGGDVEEMQKIIVAIDASRDLHFIAYVKHGFSAAAIIAATCPTIYMAPDATIGAAVPFTRAPDGTPQNIQEKFLSAYRALFRAAAMAGGHSPLLIQGMMDVDLRLELVTVSGVPCVLEAGAEPTGTLIKNKGTILTLTAPEALNCGLSAGTADSIDAIPRLMGLPGWHRADDRAWFAMLNAAEAETWRDSQRLGPSGKLASWNATVEGIRVQVARAEQQLTQVRTRRTAAEQRLLELTRQQGAELDAAKVEWQRARQDITAGPGADQAGAEQPRGLLLAADAAYQDRCERIRNRYSPSFDSASSDLDSAGRAEDQLQREIERLLASVPQRPAP